MSQPSLVGASLPKDDGEQREAEAPPSKPSVIVRKPGEHTCAGRQSVDTSWLQVSTKKREGGGMT
jgi:hypothetical protein